MRSRLLGDRTPQEFLRHYWQKRPLFVRRALPGLAGVVTEKTLAQLAARDDVESRIVERRGKRRETCHGPFTKVTAHSSGWTLLVNGVNLHVDGAHALLQRFNFVPQARLDDVMVSYATPGGGVGPHVDFYDVFLLQGPGRRAWRVENKRFVAEAGDLLYLPPGVRHDGVALERCLTYSIGFRAPRGAELGAAFLDWLHERGLPQAEYRDPDLAPASHPGRIPAALIVFARTVLNRIRWSHRDVERFLGEYLSEPKPHVVFTPRAAGRPIARSRVRLDKKTRLLYRGGRFYINGESVAVKRSSVPILRELADRRTAEGGRLAGAGLAGLISKWHRLGYLSVQKA